MEAVESCSDVAIPIRGGAWLWGILIAGAALRFFPLWFGLPYVRARPDEEVAVQRAVLVLSGDPNPHFFHWPSLTFYVFAAFFTAASSIFDGIGLDFPDTTAARIVAGRLVVAAAGSITLAVVFVIGRRIADSATGLLAALFLAVAILHVRESHFAMTDALMTLLVTVSIALLLRETDRAVAEPGAPELRGFAAAGFVGGLAASTKYSAAAVAASMAAAHVILLARSTRGLLAAANCRPSIVFAVSAGAGFLVGTPYAVLDWPSFSAGFEFNIAHLSGGHGIDLGPGWLYHLTRSLPYGAGIPIFASAVAGSIPFVRHYPRHAAILGAFAVALFASLAGGRTVFFRYVLPLVPIVCLAAAVGVRHAAQWLVSRRLAPARAAVPVLGLAVAVQPLVSCVWFDILLSRTDTRVLAAEWLAPRLTREDSLYDSGGEYTRLDLSTLPFHEWHFDPRTGSFGHPDGLTPDWLVLHESPVSYYAAAPAAVRQLALERYTLAASFPATRGRARSAVYDLQDAFFMPFSRFETVIRPGPSISIYRRTEP
jgi:4-amino-4-deoxy-L-arabinose transferase-like glycosyltransferase